MTKMKNATPGPTIKSVDTSYLQELLAQDSADMEALHAMIAEDEKRMFEFMNELIAEDEKCLSELFAMMDADNQRILENMASLSDS
jgi:hypothetical protein